jgi:hypothetical protein
MTVTTLDVSKVREAQNRTTLPVNHYWGYACSKRFGRLDMFRLIFLGRGSSHLANSPLEEQTSVGWMSGC